jgi:(R,R)-butanediol dehydrogenase/meso-butanediol dehydrogenase/diacetyl reductase
MTSGHGWDFPEGTILGHEYAGEVVDLGPGAEGFKKGDFVTALPSGGCGHCEGCHAGNLTMCSAVQGAMGGYGEYLRVPATSSIKLPSTFTMADGALVEPFAVGLYGVRHANIRPGARVLVQGGGTVALTATYWAKHLGAGRVVATSRSQRRAELLLGMGADKFIQMGPNDQQEIVEALGGKPEIVLECAGAAGLLSQAVQHAGLFGHIVSMGFCTSPDPIIPALAGMKCAKITFTVGYTVRDFEYSADLMLARGVDPKMMITSTVSLDDVPEKFEMLRGPNNETKVQITLN